MVLFKLSFASFCSLLLVAVSAFAQTATAPQPAPTTTNFVAAAPHLTTLTAAAKAAGLAETLRISAPFTIFAPTDAAFARLPAGTVTALLQHENRETLVKILTYHVISGTITATDLAARIKSGGGKAVLNTIEGESLVVTMEGQTMLLTDVNGNKSYLETADIRQSNGILHVVNGVLLPKLN